MWLHDRLSASTTRNSSLRIVILRSRSPGFSDSIVSSTTSHPWFHQRINSSRDTASVISNSASRLRSGFSPSVVRKSRKRERRLPALCFAMIAMLLESGSICAWRSRSDGPCAMAQGIALTDADRVTWLRSLAARIREAKEGGRGLVMTCSALKRVYRDVLREAGEVQFIFLRGSRAVIAERLANRRGHFMPATLLDSQFATLE